MLKKYYDFFCSLWFIKKEFRLKVLLLSSTFLLMMACVAIWRPLKMSIFAKLVGSEFVPSAKLYTLFFLVPLIIFYSKLVDRLRRHQLLYCFTIFHGIIGIIFYFVLSHPVYGIENTVTSPTRLTGWAFYFFMESFAAFLTTVFWSFADSINNPKDAKNYYGFFVSGSKIGSIIAAGSLYISLTFFGNVKDHILLPNTLLIGSLLLFSAALCIYFLIKFVPGYYMHGYEAVYQMEKKKKPDPKEQKSILQNTKESIKNSLEGLIIMIKNPYVLGIFSIIIFYEIIIVIFDYRVLRFADQTYKTAGGIAAYYALFYIWMNVIGLIFSFFGTTPILRLLGTRLSLFIFPAICIIILITTMLFPSSSAFFASFVLLRAVNYALNHPTREILYIPTTKSIKFKAKAWTDAFGSRMGKGIGSAFNISLRGAAPMFALITSMSFCLSLTMAWIIVVFFLGKTLQNAVNNKKIIGEEKAE
ncbi:NTP/NDP exchange transporter [Candidatus Dependentiae bacterium]